VDETWDDYLDTVVSLGAERDEFADAADFIRWHSKLNKARLGISKGDAKKLNLANHNGNDSYERNRASHLSRDINRSP